VGSHKRYQRNDQSSTGTSSSKVPAENGSKYFEYWHKTLAAGTGFLPGTMADGWGMPDIACHGMGCRLTQETRVGGALDDVVSKHVAGPSGGPPATPGSGRPVSRGAIVSTQNEVGPAMNNPISVYRLGEMPVQSCGQSVSAPCGKAGARLYAHTELRAKRQRSAREAIYRKRLIA